MLARNYESSADSGVFPPTIATLIQRRRGIVGCNILREACGSRRVPAMYSRPAARRVS